MERLQVTVLFLLLSSLCSGEENEDAKNTSTPVLPSMISTTTPTPTPNPVVKSTSPIGTTNNESLKTSLVSTVSSLPTVKDEELRTTTNGTTKNESIITKVTEANILLSKAVSTSQSFQNKTDNQSLTKTTEIPGKTPQPDTSHSKTSTLPSVSTTVTENLLQSQGPEDGKNASSPATSPSYSSIILPVVIALIVITLSVFVVVGLYRMCWKTDPGTTPENGNDQPQSDKESVKLLTVKTISHESGEHSAQGKSKN
ncbi:endomucin isoform X1 [Nycticebus coucang]|uniref:endomucin isoform X1 n=1 Tax=Nycticebus coucang TaxID=9470 RepID=UPI00234C7A7D|nr:endomucin isoform X1 [Nycticebus coucang]XP_053412781.1 endomucin isoform X1 [Nycticebus coucang]XP_053412870.1 endomucin isoform X1 [Nycticebus coucang]